MYEEDNDMDTRKTKRNKPNKHRLSGIDLCACGHERKCEGVCRETHTKNGEVCCSECYRIDEKDDSLFRKPKKTWRFGKQKEVDENQDNKNRRREKFEKRRSQK